MFGGTCQLIEFSFFRYQEGSRRCSQPHLSYQKTLLMSKSSSRQLSGSHTEWVSAFLYVSQSYSQVRYTFLPSLAPESVIIWRKILCRFCMHLRSLRSGLKGLFLPASHVAASHCSISLNPNRYPCPHLGMGELCNVCIREIRLTGHGCRVIVHLLQPGRLKTSKICSDNREKTPKGQEMQYRSEGGEKKVSDKFLIQN